MFLTINRQEDFIQSKWSGGVTTQLAIFPHEAQYVNRDFIWRLSTAQITVDESEFSILPGYKRILMILEGKVEIYHTDHYQCQLKPFEQDAFQGSWKTLSKGKAKDFNLIMAQNCEGYMEVLDIRAEVNITLKNSPERKNTLALYPINGDIWVDIPSQQPICLSVGELLLMSENERDIKLYHSNNQLIHVIKVTIVIR